MPAEHKEIDLLARRSLDWRFWLGWVGALLVGIGLGLFTARLLESIGWDPSPSNYAFFGLLIGVVIGLIQWLTMRERLPGFWWWIPLNMVLVCWVGFWISPWQEVSSIGPTLALVYLLVNLASGPMMLLSSARQASP